MKAREKHGLTQIGGRTYPVTAVVSGWVGAILPAIYTSEQMRGCREWLPVNGPEGRQSVGGSLATGNVEDFYRTPCDLGCGFMIKFDHEFIGRAALAAMAPERKLKRVRLVWDEQDERWAISGEGRSMT